jgi:tRNA U34 2-thiouridine synthase MnmA/TrmU
MFPHEISQELFVKALGLFSGGFDSTLAVRIVSEQGAEVIAVQFTSPFCQCDSGGCCHAAEVARQMGLGLKTFAKGDEYLAWFGIRSTGPVVLLEGEAGQAAVRLAAEVAAAYSDASTTEVSVKCQSRTSECVLRVERPARDALRPYQVIA